MKNKLSIYQKSLNLWSIILIIWSLYRANIKGINPLIEESFIKFPLFVILPYYFYEKNKLEFKKELGIVKNVLPNLAIGTALGLFTTFLIVITYWLKTHSLQHIFSLDLAVILTILLSSISEEILNKGLILKRIYEEKKEFINAVIYSALLFAIVRIPVLLTQPIRGKIILFIIVLDFLLGLITSAFFLLRKSIIVPILIHFFYALSLIVII